MHEIKKTTSKTVTTQTLLQNIKFTDMFSKVAGFKLQSSPVFPVLGFEAEHHIVCTN
jgi:hypothetical protein